MSYTPTEPSANPDPRDFQYELTQLEMEASRRQLSPEEQQRLNQLRQHGDQLREAAREDIRGNREHG